MYALPLALAVAAATADAPPVFVAAGPAGDSPAGPLVRLTPDLTATLGKPPRPDTVEDVYSLRRVGRRLPPFPTGPHLVTTTGDRVAGELLGGDGKVLRFAPAVRAGKNAAAWQVSLASAAVAWLADTPADTPPDPATYDWLAGAKNRDVLRFRNGDTARGTLLTFGAETPPSLRFRPEQGEPRTISARDIAAVAFNPALGVARKPKGPVARVVLADGSRVSLTNVAVAGGTLTGETLFGQKVEFPLTAVIALDVMQGKAVFLSDLKPAKVEQAGFLGVTWPWAADRAVTGGPLRIGTPHGNSTADKGLGTHPRTVLTYDLGRRYRRFEAVVGVDPGCAAGGKAALRILVDGTERPVAGLGNRGPGVPVRIDVTGAKELTLVTDFGPAGGVGADVTWADARLVE
jgi:hypothetical protein